MAVYCSKCRDLLSHSIAGYRSSPESYMQIEATGVWIGNKFECICKRCGHKWLSVSKDASELFKKLDKG